jgi:hypothetical protein
MVTDWGKGYIQWAQWAESNDKPVVEIRKEVKDGVFPGFTRFCCDIDQVETIPLSWQEQASKSFLIVEAPTLRLTALLDPESSLGSLSELLPMIDPCLSADSIGKYAITDCSRPEAPQLCCLPHRSSRTTAGFSLVFQLDPIRRERSKTSRPCRAPL